MVLPLPIFLNLEAAALGNTVVGAGMHSCCKARDILAFFYWK